jgi:chromosome partitioning protein
MKKIAFYNNKGGVGKTTAVINTAYSLAHGKYKVLVVDCDKQLNAYRFFSDNLKTKSTLKSTRYENIDIIFYEKSVVDLEYFKNYDYILLDLPPALNKETSEILKLTDVVFVPIDLSSFSVQGLPNVTEEISKTGVKLGGVFISRLESASKRSNAQQEVLEFVGKTLGDKLLDTKIPRSNTVEVSTTYRETVFERMHWGTASQAFGALTEEIIERSYE